MPLPRCRYCRELFTPSRFHPEQAVCSGSACQRQRRTDYHRQRIKDDPSYRAQCRDSQQKWRDRHPDYMPNYRKSGKNRAESPLAEPSNSLPRLLELVKNSAAVKLTSYPAAVWLISSDETVKNILAHARLILIEAPPPR
jgi:hypothetical protein